MNNANLVAIRNSLAEAFSAATVRLNLDVVELEVASEDLLSTAIQLRDRPEFAFAQMSDLCGVDFATYGESEWGTETDNMASFSRAVDAGSVGHLTFDSGIDIAPGDRPRFWVVTHLLSLDQNVRLRLRVACPDDDLPVIPSLTSIMSEKRLIYSESCLMAMPIYAAS